MSANKGSAGFFFFQTQDGHVLLDVNKEFEDKDKDNVINYEYKIHTNILSNLSFYGFRSRNKQR